MSFGRRDFLVRSGLALGLGAGIVTSGALIAERASRDDITADDGAVVKLATALDDWQAVRAQFNLTPDFLHFGGLYIASHPAPVREAIERHQQAMDANPVHYLQDNGGRLEATVLRAAGTYLGADPRDIALTDSTTMGLGLLYNGLDFGPG